jgi:transposase-like protein
MIRFPCTELRDEVECYQHLLRAGHPPGLPCPQGHWLPPAQALHKRERGAVVSYRCCTCKAAFKLLTGTRFSGTHYSCRVLILFVRGVLQRVATQPLAAELDCDYGSGECYPISIIHPWPRFV